MSKYSRQYAKPDANQGDIINALEKMGAWVDFIVHPVDLLVAFRGKLYLMEIKNPRGRNKLSDGQSDYIEEMEKLYGITIPVVRNVGDALRAIGAIGNADKNLTKRRA